MSVLIPGASHVDVSVRPFDLAVLSHSALTPAVIYWSDSRRNVISASRLDGSDVGVVVDASQQFRPRHVAVDACAGSVSRPPCTT